eukprot:m.77496 g.77496  ORF g.77496 m.77496 type:complete len:487 (+) comp50507_c0_seq4:163-1623(+)
MELPPPSDVLATPNIGADLRRKLLEDLRKIELQLRALEDKQVPDDDTSTEDAAHQQSWRRAGLASPTPTPNGTVVMQGSGQVLDPAPLAQRAPVAVLAATHPLHFVAQSVQAPSRTPLTPDVHHQLQQDKFEACAPVSVPPPSLRPVPAIPAFLAGSGLSVHQGEGRTPSTSQLRTEIGMLESWLTNPDSATFQLSPNTISIFNFGDQLLDSPKLPAQLFEFSPTLPQRAPAWPGPQPSPALPEKVHLNSIKREDGPALYPVAPESDARSFGQPVSPLALHSLEGVALLSDSKPHISNSRQHLFRNTRRLAQLDTFETDAEQPHWDNNEGDDSELGSEQDDGETSQVDARALASRPTRSPVADASGRYELKLAKPPPRKRRRRECKKEPTREDFASESEFRVAWTKWRDVRDLNNTSVKRCRQYAREKRSEEQQRTAARQEENRQLEEKLASLRSELAFLTRLSRRPFRALSSSEKAELLQYFHRP